VPGVAEVVVVAFLLVEPGWVAGPVVVLQAAPDVAALQVVAWVKVVLPAEQKVAALYSVDQYVPVAMYDVLPAGFLAAPEFPATCVQEV